MIRENRVSEMTSVVFDKRGDRMMPYALNDPQGTFASTVIVSAVKPHWICERSRSSDQVSCMGECRATDKYRTNRHGSLYDLS